MYETTAERVSPFAEQQPIYFAMLGMTRVVATNGISLEWSQQLCHPDRSVAQ